MCLVAKIESGTDKNCGENFSYCLALIDLYNSTDGQNWNDKENWLSKLDFSGKTYHAGMEEYLT